MAEEAVVVVVTVFVQVGTALQQRTFFRSPDYRMRRCWRHGWQSQRGLAEVYKFVLLELMLCFRLTSAGRRLYLLFEFDPSTSSSRLSLASFWKAFTSFWRHGSVATPSTLSFCSSAVRPPEASKANASTSG